MEKKLKIFFLDGSTEAEASVLSTLRRSFRIEKILHGADRGAFEVWATPAEFAAANRSDDQTRSALETAEKALHAREQMLAIVSHDLRNPLGSIQLNVETIQKKIRMASSLTEARQALPHLKSILRSYLRMKSLVSDVLDKVRIESGHFTVHPSRRELREFLLELAEVFAPLAQERSIRFNLIAPEKRVEAVMDFERIYQILSNLVGNAIKFTPPNGLIQVRAVLEPGYVEFQVQDTGPGIPKEQQDKIFGKFWQAPASPRLGVGLGLAIVKDLVKAHGGKIWLESGRGRGAHFGFQIPCQWRELQEQSSARPPEERKQICLVDDDDDLRDILRENLVELGYGVETYANGLSALEGLRRSAALPDLLLVDFRLPDMSGGELIDRLGPNLRERHVPVVFLSAENNLSSLAAEHRASAFLTKPLRLRDLTQVIESFTEQTVSG